MRGDERGRAVGQAARRGARGRAAGRRRRARPAGGRARARGSASRTGRSSPGSARPRCPRRCSRTSARAPRRETRCARRACRAARAACPCGYLRASHGWLKNVAFIMPGLVGDDGLDERLHPAPAHRPAGDRAHLDDDRRALARRQRRDRPRLAAVARQVLEQVADGLEAERRRRLGGLRRRDLQRRARAPTGAASAAARRAARRGRARRRSRRRSARRQ